MSPSRPAPQVLRSVAEPLLSLNGVTKRFGGATALERGRFRLLPGEIHGLIGENGAGKSTLMKILSGVHPPDEGELTLRGEVVRFRSPADAKAHGIGMIYQELSLMPALTVAENVFLGRQPLTTRAGSSTGSGCGSKPPSNCASSASTSMSPSGSGKLSLGDSTACRDRPRRLFRRRDHHPRRADLGALRTGGRTALRAHAPN